MGKEILTIDDIAKDLNIGIKKSYRLVKIKGCPTIKDKSKEIKIYKDDLYKWIDSLVDKKVKNNKYTQKKASGF